MKARTVRAAVFGMALGLAWPGFAGAQTQDCSTLGKNVYVRDVLSEFYLWYQELPGLDPALYDSPEAYLEAVRYRPLDTTFSYISPLEADRAFYSDSQYVGLGFSSRLVAEDDLRLLRVFPDSPASEAGLQRGFRLLAINGQPIADLVKSGQVDAALGPAEIGVAVDLTYRDLGGREGSAHVVKRPVTIPTVALTRLFDVGGRKVGYVVFENFVRPSIGALDAAFGQLKSEGATDLVLDLRYNGGGLVSVAQHLGGLIGGSLTNGRVFARFVHNDKNSFRDELLMFPDPLAALDLPRLIVITARGSASASELIVNSLRPFMRVVSVGDTTFGKPVGQYTFEFCDRAFHPVAFKLVNALEQGDYFAGFAPDCAAADALEFERGDPREASLAEALHFVEAGACSAGASGVARVARPRFQAPRPGGWQQLLGAQ